MIAELMTRVGEVLKEGGDWCGLDKAQTLAAMVLALRPRLICEVGVWTGGSLIPMLLALRTVEALETAAHGTSPRRRAVAIDAWSATASCIGQDGENRDWWRAADHDAALQVFLGRLEALGLGSICDVVRAPSERVPAPDLIGLLHLDGNHGEQAVSDVERFAAAVVPGGILVMDDLHWQGGHVLRARDRALELGFAELYPLGSGMVLQRTRT